jgi:hypothetical protein
MLTLRDTFRLLFPDIPRTTDYFARPPVLPADVFAFAAQVLDASGAYHHIAPETGDPGSGRQIVIDPKVRNRTVRVGKGWRSQTVAPGRLPAVPQRVTELWRSLGAFAKEPVFVPLRVDADCPTWWLAVIELLMIADEASQELGFDPDNPFYAPIADAFTDGDVVSVREFRRIQRGPTTLSTADASVLCVLPKSRTPSVGCTMRSLTHHLAMLPGQGAVRARWVMSPFEASEVAPESLGLLLIPVPYRMDASAFVATGDHHGRWGWFDVQQQWLPARDDQEGRRAFVDFVLDLVRQARAEGRRVDGVIFPELSLDYLLFRQVARALAEEGDVDFLISGLSSTKDGRAGNFVAIAPFFLLGSESRQATKRTGGLDYLFLIREKHHRWKLTKPQIEAYQLERALSTRRSWWEHLNLLGRSLDLFVYRGGTSLTTLICEDLARVDPCQAVLRAIGPNLVVALLMDGPQLDGRWPARYATVLAEDPGSSVLTFTSLGLIERQNATKKFPQSSAIALWKDEANGVQRLELPRDKDALFLELVADSRTEHTLDGRSDEGSAHRWVFKDYHGLAASPAAKPEWLVTGKAR